jgi:spermidine synthase
VGTQRTMLISSILLVLSAALVLGLRWQLLTIGVAALLFIPAGTIKASPGLLYETESQYQYVQVLQRSNGSRVLKLNEGVAVHSVWYPSSVLTGGEWDMFLVVPPLVGRPVQSMLVIGNAGGTIARAYGKLYPGVQIDGVEIDPKVTEVGRRYFGLGDNPNLHVITDDGRPFLQLTDKRYDLILVDAYRQPYIPFYLATREFFRLARDHLTPGGVLAINVAAVPGDDQLGDALGTTMLAEFPAVWRWQPLRFNELLLAVNGPTTESTLRRRVGEVPIAARSLVPLFRSGVEPMSAHGEPLTDDRAPVEWLTDSMIVDFIAHGGELDEQPLPTQP